MKRALLIVCVGIACLITFAWGFYEGDKHALDTMRLIGCQGSEVESFGMRELPPENEPPESPPEGGAPL